MSKAGPGPTIPSASDTSEEPEITEEDVDEIKETLEEVRSHQQEEKDNHQQFVDPIDISIESLEDIFNGIVLAGVMMGVIGIIISILAQSAGFASIFIIGITFFIYVLYHGFPLSENE